MHFYYIFCHTRGHPKTARNPRVRVRVQKCTRGSTCGRVFSNPADLPTGGFSSNPHPHPRVPSLAMISSAPQCTFYSSCSLCAPDSGRDSDFFPLPYMYTAPPCVYKGGGGLYLLGLSHSLTSTLSYDHLLSLARSFS